MTGRTESDWLCALSTQQAVNRKASKGSLIWNYCGMFWSSNCCHEKSFHLIFNYYWWDQRNRRKCIMPVCLILATLSRYFSIHFICFQREKQTFIFNFFWRFFNIPRTEHPAQGGGGVLKEALLDCSQERVNSEGAVRFNVKIWICWLHRWSLCLFVECHPLCSSWPCPLVLVVSDQVLLS